MTITAPTSATGYANDSTAGWWSDLSSETLPELRWPLSVAVYDAMRRQDAQVAAVLRAVMLPVLRTPWRVAANGADPKVTRMVADDLGLPVEGEDPKPLARTRDRFSWSEHLELALTMLPFGHAFFEWDLRFVDGYWRLRRLGFRPQRTISEVKVARDGGLVSIQQSATDKPIPVKSLVAYVHAKEGGNWLGTSLLRPAYKHWLLKDRLMRVQTVTVERFGAGIPIYTAAPPDTVADKDAEKAAGLALAQGARAGDNSGGYKPHGSLFELKAPDGDLPDALPGIRYHDDSISKVVLGHFMNLGQSSGTGSYALGVTFVDVFNQSLQTVAQAIAQTATQHIVEDLVDWNFGQDVPAPKVVFDEIGSHQAATAAAIKSLIEAGAIFPDPALDAFIRQTFDLPPAAPRTPFQQPAPTDGGTE